MPKVLWVGDAVATTGFSTVTHNVLGRMSDRWDKVVLGVNHFGDPHEYPYPIYSTPDPEDRQGFKSILRVLKKEKPDVVLLLTDPWWCPHYLKNIPDEIPVVGYLAVDGDNMQSHWISGLSRAVFWTYYGQQCAHASGYRKDSPVVPLGVDTDVYRPYDKQKCREHFGLPDDKILIGAVATNQIRKRLDLTLSYFADLLKSRNDVCLLVHTKTIASTGWDLKQLAHYFKIPSDNFYIGDEGLDIGVDDMPMLYSCLDFQISTVHGEGWGLTQMEGMACGVPQIVPDWSALGEWAAPAARVVPCDEIWVTRGGVNIIGGVPNRKEYVGIMKEMCYNMPMRSSLYVKGLKLVRKERYKWENIASEIEGILDVAVTGG